MFRNFKSVNKCAYGRGSFDKLGDILAEKRETPEACMVFLVDEVFKGNQPFIDRIPLLDQDLLFWISVSEEPTTDLVDGLRDEILEKKGLPAGVIGIGGGSVMDTAKATSLMLTNEGSSTLYQGLNLIKKPGIYHVGVPTISGTGAEVSMTAVLTGPEKKLGLKCDWTVFDQIVLDPDLIETVPTNQWFYTGMDCYIHCVESMTGIFKNTFSEAYGWKSLEMCQDIFLNSEDGRSAENEEKLMVASYMGGLSLTYSEVGVCHALSYGLSKIFHYHHGIANCIAFNQLKDVYGEYVDEFHAMVEKHNIDIPQNLSANWSEDEIDQMAEVAIRLEHMWIHAFGHNWKEVLDKDRIKGWYRRM
ncbi:iron-containing alcohol dehydrogenase family protein [Rapidithrix thailandica]|uniref:Iron-containing alcohol dehydrogenase family protein n=1 Tax=Rapidithrix thailandica TaxID=413964 RepID=A0AAW9SEJ9_9BACT